MEVPKMPDLHTTYLGLQLRSPLVASAGPLTGQLDRLVELELAGAGAVVLPSIFEEQIERETAEIDRLFTVHDESFNEATSFFPEVDDYGSAIDSYLELIENAKMAVDIPVIASLNGANIGGWVKYAKLLEGAGADALELNLYTVAADPHVTGAALEAEHLELVALVAEEIEIPVAVKISPYYSSVASFVAGLQHSGAAGVVMFNRFYSPDLDLETLEVMPRIALSTPEELRLPLRWTGIMREYLTMSIGTSTGVHSGFDAAKLILAGADVTMTTSALLHHGTAHLATMKAQLCEWMDEHEYTSVRQMRGAVASHAATDPAAYERANYIGNIATYTSRFIGSGAVPLARHRPE
jgi:dihydroorotate dehydrogenase (fumarate)